MTSSRAAANRIVLIRDTPRGPSGPRRPAAVRHYRLARLRVDGTSSPEDRAGRFAHLKRVYD